MPYTLNVNKLYKFYYSACEEVKVEPMNKEDFGFKISEGFYYLLSAMVEEKIHVLSLVYKIKNDISCLIAPFSGGDIKVIFGTNEKVTRVLNNYKDLVEKNNTSDPTELF